MGNDRIQCKNKSYAEICDKIEKEFGVNAKDLHALWIAYVRMSIKNTKLSTLEALSKNIKNEKLLKYFTIMGLEYFTLQFQELC
jgi:hypothetical protein